MSDYGLEVYCGDGLKLLSTAEMGLAFDLVRNGLDVNYASSPNKYSQVEFPLSPVISQFWNSTADGVVSQFRGGFEDHLVDYMYSSGTLAYNNGHISRSSGPLLGLTNTIGSQNGGSVEGYQESIGIFAKDSLVNVASNLGCYFLTEKSEISSIKMYRKRGSHNFASPMMHLLLVPILSPDDVIALYPTPNSPTFSIGLYTRTPALEIYVIFSEAEAVTLTVYRYSKNFITPIYGEYGLEVFNQQSQRIFSSANSPLLPIFVTNSRSINTLPEYSYNLACVFSRVDGFVYHQFRSGDSRGTACCMFNGISWGGARQWTSQMMGFSEGPGFTMGTLDEVTWDRIDRSRGNWNNVEWSAYNTQRTLPYFAPYYGISKQSMLDIGAFMGVVAY